MPDESFIFIAAVFLLAGLAKGVIGLGLPTISMGLLALAMTPLQAAAILVLPSFLTNVWQMLAGPSLRAVSMRLWPMMLGICLGTWLAGWAGAGLMSGGDARYGSGLLGVALMAYAATGLGSIRFSVGKMRERWLGPAAGAATGLVAAATGVFVIPSVPYLQAIGLEKEELVQALGLSFTVSTLALAVNLARAGALDVALAAPTLTALATACAGMWLGQILRSHLPPQIFRRCFFGGLLLLGAYLVIAAWR
jgi:uncharacterized membrane protein YfcA